MTTTASSSRSAAVPASLAARLRLLPARPIDGSLETIRTANGRNNYGRWCTASNGFVDEVSKGAANFEKVVGIRIGDLLGGPPTHETRYLENLKDIWGDKLASWASISRGSDVFIRGLPRFDILAVYDEIITQRTRGITFPSWERLLAEIEAGKLLHAANELRHEDPARWGPRFTRKEDAIRCLLDEHDGLGDGLAEFCKAHEVEWSKESMNSHPGWKRPSSWILTPDELRARGHFPRIFAGFLSEATDSSTLNSQAAEEYQRMLDIICSILTDLNDTDMIRDHLLRHHGSWDHPDRGGCLDELYDCNGAVNMAGFAEMEPPQLINALREYERLQQRDPDAHYEHLDDLQGTSELFVLRSSLELKTAGERLNNCALSYADKVQMRECVLVELRDASGKPTAIGQFDMAKAEWVQIRETCNRMPTDATRAAFIGYTAVIQAWRARSNRR
ncbi:hypothetical protein M885DRAFT_524673 [Pelagophyceae sp. CCMP2097]|nr:hypothetical protein M885DRAFT_524673 [Pelagophyceae sp. CCMP2097]